MRCLSGRLRPLALALALVLLSGCASLLPSSRDEVPSAWASYDDAVAALAALEPYKATRADVHLQGLDPRANPAIRLLHFADLLQRFAAAALIKPDEVDRGIRDCLQAGKRCSGYAVAVRKLRRERVGNFWLDSLNFRRETVSTGFSVEILLVFVDERMVYELIGGEPNIHDVSVRRNPLGPLQGWGSESLRVLP
jgi:hypothetical protein